ncbi:MAG: LCP family protein [Candidatus Moranbacteria bacterium]|nr:LCP family protein [Candidatus Moranbacteria bacterium]
MAISKKNEAFFKKAAKKVDFETKETKGKEGREENREIKAKKKIYKRKWFWAVAALFVIGAGTGGFFAYKTGYILNKISEKNQSNFGSLFSALPVVGKKQDIKEDKEGRINVLMIGMRGENMPGGGLLADTVMVATLKPEEKKVGLISIPRDLYVKAPGTEHHSKINSIYYYGEKKQGTTGLQEMKKVASTVTGLDIHYAAALNFEGFRQLVNAVGGIEINLETPFYEVSQFVEGNECGGRFILPAGENLLDGEQALCYVRARTNTSDFDRAKRQQLILKKLKEQLTSLGTLSNFSKVNGILNAVGDNVKTDMDSNEMKKFFEKYNDMKDAEIKQRVFENSPEGYLKVPEEAAEELGYILIPRAGWDNYSEIHEVCQNIFNLPDQSDVDPLKQRYEPRPAVKEEGKKKDSSEESANEEKSDEEKDIEIDLEKKLDLSDGLEAEISQKIEEITVEGEKDDLKKADDEIEIDLSDIEIEEEGDFKYKIKDLIDVEDDLEGLEIISHDSDDTLLKIKVQKIETEENADEEEQDEKNEDSE